MPATIVNKNEPFLFSESCVVSDRKREEIVFPEQDLVEFVDE